MSRFQTEPSEALLHPYVHSYWGLSRDLSEVGGFTVTPDRFVELLVFLDPPSVEAAGTVRPLPHCTLIPLLDRPLRLVASGVVCCAAARLYPWAAGLILPQADKPGACWHDASDAFGELLGPVRTALQSEDWKTATACFDPALQRAFANAAPAASTLTAARLFAALPNGAKPVATAEVAGQQGRSRRQVERDVRRLTHVSPKQLSSLARFQYVRDTLWAQPAVGLATLAFEAGYADQAHLTRAFRRYAGQTPGEFIRSCARLKAFVAAQDVAILQDDWRAAGEGTGA